MNHLRHIAREFHPLLVFGAWALVFAAHAATQTFNWPSWVVLAVTGYAVLQATVGVWGIRQELQETKQKRTRR